MRVFTYNIHKSKGFLGRPTTITQLASRMSERSPDLILCQEVFHGHDSRKANQTAELADSLGFKSAYVANSTYRRGHHGNATLTRFQVLHHEHVDLSTNVIERRGVLYTVLQTENGPLHVFNTHLGLNRWQRHKQIQRIISLIQQQVPASEAVILAGDFNDWTGHLDQWVQNESRLSSALTHTTKESRRSFPSRTPLFGLDRIYYDGLQLIEANVLRSPTWHYLSDHLPLEADFVSPLIRSDLKAEG